MASARYRSRAVFFTKAVTEIREDLEKITPVSDEGSCFVQSVLYGLGLRPAGVTGHLLAAALRRELAALSQCSDPEHWTDPTQYLGEEDWCFLAQELGIQLGVLVWDKNKFQPELVYGCGRKVVVVLDTTTEHCYGAKIKKSTSFKLDLAGFLDLVAHQSLMLFVKNWAATNKKVSSLEELGVLNKTQTLSITDKRSFRDANPENETASVVDKVPSQGANLRDDAASITEKFPSQDTCLRGESRSVTDRKLPQSSEPLPTIDAKSPSNDQGERPHHDDDRRCEGVFWAEPDKTQSVSHQTRGHYSQSHDCGKPFHEWTDALPTGKLPRSDYAHSEISQASFGGKSLPDNNIWRDNGATIDRKHSNSSTNRAILTSVGSPPILTSMERVEVARWIQDFRLYRRQGGPIHACHLLGNIEWVIEGLWNLHRESLDLGPWDTREILDPEDFAELIPRLDAGPQVAADDLVIEAPRATKGEFKGLLDPYAFNANIKSFQDRHPEMETKIVLEVIARSLTPVVPYFGTLVKAYVQKCKQMGTAVRIAEAIAIIYQDQAKYVRLHQHLGLSQQGINAKEPKVREKPQPDRKRSRNEFTTEPSNPAKFAKPAIQDPLRKDIKTCSYCQKKGHKESECRRKKADEKNKA